MRRGHEEQNDKARDCANLPFQDIPVEREHLRTAQLYSQAANDIL